ncbi:MAG: signal peptidase [Planctomycetota bacterium]|nr:MAG: signal peptidase [Planctomycetota bacterium]
MAQGETVKHKVQKHKKLMLVRYGRMGHLGWFEHKESYIPKTQTRVVIKTNRGLELGELVGRFNYRSGHFKSTPEQVQQYFGKTQKDYPLAEGGTFVRFATAEDVMEEKHLEASAKEEMQCCQRFVSEMKLPMKIIDAEHVFGGERIVIYFTSSSRVDFRELVKRLAREYQTRIELRQIGARDEARIISDYESCGLPCCCRQFLKILEPVNMRMAKLQKATLDPSKISGHCGRLKCCLRYEDATYKDLKRKLPRKNATVRTSRGVGKVVDMQILTQLVVVQDEAGEKKAFSVDEIEIIDEQNRPTEPTAKDCDEKQGDKTSRSSDKD